MRRLTIFSLKACRHCGAAKRLLEDLGLAYYSIDVEDYPEKRADMIKLANKSSVPQIFFNEEHIGGAAELMALHKAGSLRSKYEDMQKTPDPTSPLLQRPDSPPRAAETLELKEEVVTVGDLEFSSAELSKWLEKNLKIRNRTYHLKSYPNTFLGSDLVELLCREKGFEGRKQATAAGERLRQMGYFDHVSQKKKFFDGGMYYRLMHHLSPWTLNSNAPWNGAEVSSEDGAPLVFLKQCSKLLDSIVVDCTDSQETQLIDYSAVARDPRFEEFEAKTCVLQKVHLHKMPLPHRLAFCINVYNMIIKHSFARLGPPASSVDRYFFFDKVGYNIGGLVFSLNEIENGILRGNKVAPYHLRRYFQSEDPRLKCAMREVDPRIHFALNCGATSCPPVKSYSGEAVDEELRLAAMSFLEEPRNFKIESKERTMLVSRILKWYRADFGATAKEVVTFLSQWFSDEQKEQHRKLSSGGPFTIQYLDYDWTSNAKPR